MAKMLDQIIPTKSIFKGSQSFKIENVIHSTFTRPSKDAIKIRVTATVVCASRIVLVNSNPKEVSTCLFIKIIAALAVQYESPLKTAAAWV